MKVFHKPIRLLLTLCLLAQLLLIPSFAADAPVYLALGDSISTGYGLSETDPGFVEQLADCYPDFTLVNEAVNGNTPAGVYEQLKDGALDSYLTNAKLITQIDKIDDSVRALAGGSASNQGTGGMATKIQAAEICMNCGCEMIITNGDQPENLYLIMEGKPVGTTFARK